MTASTIQLTGLPLNEAHYKTENSLKDEATIKLLESSMDKNA